MALVEIARFLDATEAQVAAAALRASGVETLVQNELHGQNFYFMQQAIGGFGLLVPEGDAPAARALIEAARSTPPELPEKPRRTKTFLAVLTGLMFGG